MKYAYRNPQPKTKIMIVEDEIISAKAMANNLTKQGYIVSGISVSGEDAVKKIEQDKPDLALMDIMLKGEMDGIEAAGIIRSRFDVPSIFITAYADQSILDRAKKVESFGYLIKPVAMREIHSNIEMTLYKHSAEKKLKKVNRELKDSLNKVKLLSGLIPICANCKNIRNDKGYYEKLERYIQEHSNAQFSHGICPKCAKKLYPEIFR